MNPERFEPRLPEWFKETQGANYAEVLKQEMAKLQTDPSAYFEGQNFYVGKEKEERKMDFQEMMAENSISRDEVKALLEGSCQHLLKDLGFEGMPEEIEELKKGEAGRDNFTPEVEEDFKNITETLTRRIHGQVLRTMVREYLPRRKVILHRGTFEKEGKKETDEIVKGETRKNLPWLAAKKLLHKISKVSDKLKPALTYGYKSPHFRIEQIKGNLRQGVGGIEIDIKMNRQGEPVVTHSYLPRDIEKAPHLDEFLKMIREVLPDDPKAPRQARRGLKLFLHTKISSQEKYRDFPAAVLNSLDKYDMGKQSIMMATRPETIYAFDQAEEQMRAGGKLENKGPRHMFQYIPIGEISGVVKKWGERMGRLGVKSPYYKGDELHSKTKWFYDEHLFLNDFPHGRLTQVLKKHEGIVGVSSAGYNKEMLAKAEQEGVRLSLGGYKGSEVDEMLEPDEQGRRPLTIEGLSEKTIYPEKSIPRE